MSESLLLAAPSATIWAGTWSTAASWRVLPIGSASTDASGRIIVAVSSPTSVGAGAWSSAASWGVLPIGSASTDTTGRIVVAVSTPVPAHVAPPDDPIVVDVESVECLGVIFFEGVSAGGTSQKTDSEEKCD